MILDDCCAGLYRGARSPRSGTSCGLLSDLDHHNVKRLAERGEAALRLVYSVLNHTIRRKSKKQGQISAFLSLKICYPGVRCR